MKSSTVIMRNKSMEEIKTWFKEHGYNQEDVETGYFGIYAEGYQDADFYTVRENVDGTYTLISE